VNRRVMWQPCVRWRCSRFQVARFSPRQDAKSRRCAVCRMVRYGVGGGASSSRGLHES
jgi:hypothetical protein